MRSGRQSGGSTLGRFAVVGVVNTAIDFVIFGVLATLGVPVLVANFVSTSAGMTFSFLVNRSWTFRSTRSMRSTLGPFFLVTAVGLWVIQPLVILLVGDLLDALVPTMATDLRTVWLPKAVAIGVGLLLELLVVPAGRVPALGGEPPVSRVPEGLAIRVGSLVVAACFLWVTVNVVLAPQYGTVRWPQLWVSLGAAVVLVLLVLAVVASRGVVAWLEDHAWVRRGVVATSLVVMYAVQVRLGYSIRFNPGWDAGFLEVNTRAIADGTLPVGSVAETLAAYPNNLLFASLLTRYWRAWLGAGYTDGELAMVLLNAAVLCASVVFVYLAARRLGAPSTAYVAGVFCSSSSASRPGSGSSTPTRSDAPDRRPGDLAVLLRDATGPSRAALWAAVGLVGALGYAIKPTIVFAVLGIGLVALLGPGPADLVTA